MSKRLSMGLGVSMVFLVSLGHFLRRLVAWQLHVGFEESRDGLGPHWVVCSFVLHYTGLMGRPKGRTKPARLTVNLDRLTYLSVLELARREDVSVSWVVRRAIETLLARDRATPIGPALTPHADRADRPTFDGMAP